MKRNTRFNERSGVFTCCCCKHRTRLTSDIDELCEPCFELGGIDNYFNDNDRDHTSESAAGYLREANGWLETIRKNAGDEAAQRVKDSCEYIWPAKS